MRTQHGGGQPCRVHAASLRQSRNQRRVGRPSGSELLPGPASAHRCGPSWLSHPWTPPSNASPWTSIDAFSPPGMFTTEPYSYRRGSQEVFCKASAPALASHWNALLTKLGRHRSTIERLQPPASPVVPRSEMALAHFPALSRRAHAVAKGFWTLVQ